MKKFLFAVSFLALTAFITPAAHAIAPLPPKPDQEKIDKAQAKVEKFQEEILREFGKLDVLIHEANRL